MRELVLQGTECREVVGVHLVFEVGDAVVTIGSLSAYERLSICRGDTDLCAVRDHCQALDESSCSPCGGPVVARAPCLPGFRFPPPSPLPPPGNAGQGILKGVLRKGTRYAEIRGMRGFPTPYPGVALGLSRGGVGSFPGWRWGAPPYEHRAACFVPFNVADVPGLSP